MFRLTIEFVTIMAKKKRKKVAKKKKKGKKSSRFQIFKFLFKIIKHPLFRWTVVGLVIILTANSLMLRHEMVKKFEGHKWNLPSKIYSDAFPLYNGQTLPVNQLKERLRFLNYRKVASSPKEVGQYQEIGNHFEIFLHDFDYPHKKFKGYPISFDIENERIRNLHSSKKSKLRFENLEPELIGAVFDKNMEDRTFVSLDKIPDTMKWSVVLIEDERFYEHKGVDPIGIMRAFVVNFMKGGFVQGGSTLTQQLIKNYFLTQKKTLTRKINEMIMAFMMELKYSKEEILEAYLNEIYFGQRGNVSVSGIYEAAQFYFSKNVSQLDAAECAMLAAMIKAPGLYSPFRHPDRARKRRNIVLTKLFDQKKISLKEYHAALKKPLPKKTKRTYKKRYALHFIDYLKKQLREHYSQDFLSSYGYRIFTTLDMYLQRKAEDSLKKHLKALENQRQYLKKNAEKKKYLEGGLIALTPRTGYIRAYVGGRNFGRKQFDHITQAKRQTGSLFKPFVYLTALDPSVSKVFTLASILPDEKIGFDTPQGVWVPKNYDKVYHGKVSLRTALEHSYNVSTVWLGNEVGFEHVVDMAKRAGITADLKPYPSLVLGAFEVSPLELVSAYSIFPNNGLKTRPLAIRRVVTPEGEVLEKKSFDMQRVISKDVAYLMNRLLSGVFDNGTAKSARARGFYAEAAGKTGTTSSYRDAWFAGYVPDLVALVWVGYDDNSPTRLSGSSGALPIWVDFMKTAIAGKGNQRFKATKNIIEVPIDSKTGLLYHRGCEDKIIEHFIEGTEPTEKCND